MADTRHRPQPFSRLRPLVALLAALTVAPAAARAEGPVGPGLTWAEVPAAAAAAFDAGPGQAMATRARGDRAAAAAVAGDLESLDLASRWDRDLSGPAGNELTLDALVVWRLGRVATTRRDAWRAEATARDAERDLARFAFSLEAQRRFVAWWERSALAEHAREHLSEQARFLAPARAAAEQQLLSRLLLSDLEVEAARVEVEATSRQGDADVAARDLAALLGPEVHPSAAGLEGVDHLTAVPANPWRAVAAQLATHPELRALAAAAAAARAHAAAAAAEGPARLQLGLGLRQTGPDSTWGGLLVGLSVPLGDAGADEAARQRAEATASVEARAWRLRTLSAEVDALATRYEAAVARLTRVQTALVGPMGERVLLYERAVLAGRADLEQLVRARRDLLEAHHALVHAAAEVLGHRAHADAMATLLAAPSPGAHP